MPGDDSSAYEEVVKVMREAKRLSDKSPTAHRPAGIYGGFNSGILDRKITFICRDNEAVGIVAQLRNQINKIVPQSWLVVEYR